MSPGRMSFGYLDLKTLSFLPNFKNLQKKKNIKELEKLMKPNHIGCIITNKVQLQCLLGAAWLPLQCGAGTLQMSACGS